MAAVWKHDFYLKHCCLEEMGVLIGNMTVYRKYIFHAVNIYISPSTPHTSMYFSICRVLGAKRIYNKEVYLNCIKCTVYRWTLLPNSFSPTLTPTPSQFPRDSWLFSSYPSKTGYRRCMNYK